MNLSARTFKKTPKQKEAIIYFKEYDEILLEGGSRSGKTSVEIYAMIQRGLWHPGTRHLILRKHFNHAKISLWFDTIPKMFKIAFPEVVYESNKSDWFFEFGEGSQLWIGGTDDKERIEKILGTEWATILLNEISQMPYITYELLKTRLNPPMDVKPILMMDQNPPTTSHWSYLKFHLNIDPETRKPLSEDNIKRQKFLKINPLDNKDNLSDNYFRILESLSEKRQRRFLKGEYTDDSENAIFKRDHIAANRVRTIEVDLVRLVVAVDPAVTGGEDSDETGIIICGEALINEEVHYFIADDRTYHGPVTGWGESAVNAYKDFQCDKIIGEINNGGDLVEINIRNYDRNISYESVRASRGKAIRAEPVADLYRRGFVHHIGEFPELEDEMCTWIPGEPSPNRMDALVWGISYLARLGDCSVPAPAPQRHTDRTRSKVMDLPI